MTRDEIISLAHEAGFEHQSVVVGERPTAMLGRGQYLVEPVVKQTFGTGHVEVMERFAALIAAKEREACAQVCEQHPWIDGKPLPSNHEMARAIRARDAQ